ncbi:MAG: hypothetical protein ACK4UO_19490 [Pseudolabrys sp.]
MRLETAEHHTVRAEERGVYEHDDGDRSGMTPARRAALDALEREFRELLQAMPTQ